MGIMPKPDITTADNGGAEDAAPAPTRQRTTPATQSRQPAPRNPGSTASNKLRVPAAHQVPEPSTATWQSLLPGSIQ